MSEGAARGKRGPTTFACGIEVRTCSHPLPARPVTPYPDPVTRDRHHPVSLLATRRLSRVARPHSRQAQPLNPSRRIT